MRYEQILESNSVNKIIPALFILVVVGIAGCQPSDRTPGLRLRGEPAQGLPSDWTFTDEYREIYVEVATPYWLPHSVTIWCAQVQGQLFIGARNPESKNWPGWADKNPKVTLKIGDFLYNSNLDIVTDEAEIARIKLAYAEKYQLSSTPGETPPPMRYWRVGGR